MIDLGFVIDAEAVSMTVARRSNEAFNDEGRATYDEDVASLLATIQPMTGYARKDLPEGVRTEATHVLWTRGTLDVQDLVIYREDAYRVVHLWPRDEGNFLRAALGKTQ